MEHPDKNERPGPPLNDVWATLRKRWLAIEPAQGEENVGRRGKRTSESLTEYLNVSLGRSYTPQGVSQWATGSDNRNPPWEAILLLMRDLNLDLKLSGEGEAWLLPRTVRGVRK